jgi:hypothetical protein
LILFIYRSKVQGNNIADNFNRMGIPSFVCSPEKVINNVSNKYKAIVVSIPSDDYAVYDAEFVYSLKIYYLGAPVFAICNTEDLNKVEALYAYDKVFTTAMTPNEVRKHIQLHQYDNDLPRTGVYRLKGLDASLNLEHPQYYYNEMVFTHNEKMVLRTLITMYPSPVTANELLKHAMKKNNSPDSTIIRTIISGINKKFKEEFKRKLIEISEDKSGYIIITPSKARQFKYIG